MLISAYVKLALSAMHARGRIGHGIRCRLCPEWWRRHRVQERDTAGDEFFVTFDGPARAIRCGQAIVAAMEPLGLRVRIGIHIGECELHEDKVTGMAVLVGARIAAIAGPGEVLVSGTTRDLVAGSGLAFSDRGDHQLKGLPGTWSIHEAQRNDV
jgi:class 3 adenylate cyclase